MKLIFLTKIGMAIALAGGVLTAVISPKPLLQLMTASPAASVVATPERYTLVSDSIQDGDTFKVSDGRQEIKVSLCGIVAPELGQTHGDEARAHLRSLFARGSGDVILTALRTDEQDRITAEIFLPISDSEEEIHLNSQMVADGMAYVYPANVSTCQNAGPIRIAEQLAQEEKLGVWSQPTE